MAGTSSSVWVGGVPEGLDDESFQALFVDYGTVVSSKLYPHKWYGFVDFSTPEEAEAAVALLDGADCGGRTLKVRIHTPGAGKGESAGKGKGKGKGSWSSPYGSAPSSGAEDLVASLLGGWKAVKEGASQKEAWAPPGLNAGSGAASAAAAMLASIGKGASKGKGWNGAWAKGSGGASLADPSMAGACCTSQDGLLPGRSPDYTTGDGEGNLYIESLPEDADQLYLYKIFAPFGGVLSTYVKDTAKGRIGFVSYQNATEAQYAIQRLNGAQTATGQALTVRVQNQKKGAGKW